MEPNSFQPNIPFVRSFSSDPVYNNVQGRSLLASHSVNLPIQNSRTMVGDTLDQSGFQRRTVDGARQLRDNLNNVIRGIGPLVDTARIVNARTMAISSFLNSSTPNNEASSSTNQPNNSFVINLDDANPSVQDHDNTQEVPNNQENLNNNNGRQDDMTANDRTIIEAQRSLRPLQKYIPFLLILLAKGLYDHHEGIINFAVLFITFTYTNSVVRKEATKRSKRSLYKLLLALAYIALCIIFINYIFENEKLYMSLIFIKTFEKPLRVWDLLWFVGITDFILKLITVGLKIIVIITPGRLIPYQKRVRTTMLFYTNIFILVFRGKYTYFWKQFLSCTVVLLHYSLGYIIY